MKAFQEFLLNLNWGSHKSVQLTRWWLSQVKSLHPTCRHWCLSYICSSENISLKSLAPYRRWAGKTSFVHLAPEHEYRAKHLMMKSSEWLVNSSCSMDSIHLGLCQLSCGPETCMKLIYSVLLTCLRVNTCSGAKCIWSFSYSSAIWDLTWVNKAGQFW